MCQISCENLKYWIKELLYVYKTLSLIKNRNDESLFVSQTPTF